MSTILYTLTYPQSFVGNSQQVSDASTASISRTRAIEKLKYLYQADQQAKYLHLHAEVDSLLQQLQTIKQQRQALADEATTGENLDDDTH